MAVTVAELHGLPPVAAAAVGTDGPPLDPQLDSVIEGDTVKVRLTTVDPRVRREALGLADASWHHRRPGPAPSMDPVDIAANGESETVDLTVRENEEVNPETLVLGAEVAGERAYGRKTRTSPGILSLAIKDATRRRVEAKPEDDIHAALTAAMATAVGDHGLKPIADFDLTASDLFDADVGVTVSNCGRLRRRVGGRCVHHRRRDHGPTNGGGRRPGQGARHRGCGGGRRRSVQRGRGRNRGGRRGADVGCGGQKTDVSVSFHLWVAAVLAAGAYRRYARQQLGN